MSKAKCGTVCENFTLEDDEETVMIELKVVRDALGESRLHIQALPSIDRDTVIAFLDEAIGILDDQ